MFLGALGGGVVRDVRFDTYAYFRWDGFFMFGVLPVALVWGVAWVVAGFLTKPRSV